MAEGEGSGKVKQRWSPTSFRDRLMFQRGQFVHKLKAKDSTGRWAYYFILIPPAREPEFKKALKSNESIDLEDYGRVVASCYGEEPNEATRNLLRERYGYDV